MSDSIGRFEIRRELGRGAQSAVYLAWDPQLEREVAIKTLHFAKPDPARNKALLGEARAVSQLKHPNVVPIYDMGEEGGNPYLVFECVDGPTLADLIRKEGRIGAARAADMMRHVLDALAQAHKAGLIHRDLKPSNILIDAAGKPRVMDFGIATRLDESEAGETAQARGITGTPAYLAPEYIERHELSEKTDVYAAGLVLFEMVTGKRAVEGESLVQIAYRIAHEPIKLPTDLGLDDKLAAIIHQACVKDPALRTESAAAMRQQLDDYMGAAATPLGSAASDANKGDTLDFLLRRMRHKTDFPALSDSVSAINRLTNSDKESINRLSNTILKDYGLTNKILRLVNSAYFRQSGGGNISTVSRAVIVLGFDAVRNIAITILLFEHLQNKSNARELKESFLRANLAGMLARDVSRKFMARETEEAYICALFHNLGQLLAQFYFPEEIEEIRKIVLQKSVSTEVASAQVLGMSFSDLGIGVARTWGFPTAIVNSLRPLASGQVRRPETHEETLRVVAGFANELCDLVASVPTDDRQKAMRTIGKRFADSVPVGERQLQAVLEQTYEELAEQATVLRVNLKQSPFARQLKVWAGGHDPVEAAPGAAEGMAQTVLQDATVVGSVPAEGAEASLDEDELPAAADDAQDILAAGIQDISNSLVDDFSLNDILRITLETMYRAMGFQRVLLCLKDPKSGTMAGRFGFGAATTELARQFRFPLAYAPDVFHLAVTKGLDIIITDIDDPKIVDKVPGWYRKISLAKTFVLFPLTIKGNPVALIYADSDKAGSIRIPEKELTLLKTLRNQAVLAIKQST